MTSKAFFFKCIAATFLLLILVIGINVYLNPYGVFGNSEGKSYTVAYNERTSKYLFSFNYVPSNFEGIVIGPSLSDNINTANFKHYKVYNASINGGNISELKYITDNISRNKGRIKFAILCLDPYITKDHGKKTSYLGVSDYFGALGSIETIKYYKYKSDNQDWNEYGYNNFNVYKKDINVQENILKAVDEFKSGKRDIKVDIDSVAYSELEDVINSLKQAGIQIFAFYYPKPYALFGFYEGNYRKYQQSINSLFTDEDIVWDFNTEEYVDFRNDFRNYSDGAHLSDSGAEQMLFEIEKRVQAYYQK